MGTDITNYDEAWAAQAAQAATAEPVNDGGNFLSTRGGQLTFQEQPMPGNQVACIVIDSYRENTYYANRYDPDNPAPPTCYAFARDAEHMAPHPSMQVDLNYFRPQNAQCDGCPMNEWGSSDTGRGKACQNRRRLAVLPAGFYSPRPGSRDFDLDLFEDSAHFESADLGFLKLPVTSVGEWSKYVQQVAASVRRPPFGVVTRIYCEPDAKSQYKIKFEMIDVVPDNLAQIIMTRHDAEANKPFQGYQPPSADDKPPVTGGLRR